MTGKRFDSIGEHNISDIAGKINRPGEKQVCFILLKGSYTDFNGLKTGCLFAGNNKTGTAELEFLCNPAGDNTAQRAGYPCGCEGRAAGIL